MSHFQTTYFNWIFWFYSKKSKSFNYFLQLFTGKPLASFNEVNVYNARSFCARGEYLRRSQESYWRNPLKFLELSYEFISLRRDPFQLDLSVILSSLHGSIAVLNEQRVQWTVQSKEIFSNELYSNEFASGELSRELSFWDFPGSSEMSSEIFWEGWKTRVRPWST